MLIKNLILQNFKNHLFQQFDFSPQINCFVGNNGVGKTNILDALFYLSVGKSFLNTTDIQNISNNEDFFTIEATIENEDKDDILKIDEDILISGTREIEIMEQDNKFSRNAE